MPQRKLQQLLARLEPEEVEMPEVVDRLIELGEADPDRVVPAVLGIPSADPLVREAVLQVLGGIGPGAKAAIPFLVARLRDAEEDEHVQFWAANALGQMGTESHAALMKLCKDADPSVRYRAVNELGNIGIYTPAVIKVLLNTLADPVKEVRGCARDSLVRGVALDPGLIAHLTSALKHRSASVRVAAAHTLLAADPNDRAALQTLVKVLGEGPAEARVWACEALALAKEKGVFALEELRACLRHEEPAVRAKAAKALGELQLLALPAVDELGQALHDAFADVRFWSAHALMRLDELAEPVAGDLVRALEARIRKGRDAEDSECFLFTCLVRAVGNVGRAAKDALPALKRAQKEIVDIPDAGLHKLVRWSIRRCQGKA
jgi:HEAT repeat protein